jgi:hypothetical protein
MEGRTPQQVFLDGKPNPTTKGDENVKKAR